MIVGNRLLAPHADSLCLFVVLSVTRFLYALVPLPHRNITRQLFHFPLFRKIANQGILVEAVRRGYWIVLDELNLAPSEVLEALNRLLDDNRELFIAETQACGGFQ